MFSKKTQQFVQKVRPKSIHISKVVEPPQQQSSSDELTHSNTIECDSIENEQNSLNSSNNNNSGQSSFTIYQKNFLSSNSKSPILADKKQNIIDDQKLNGFFI